MGDTALNARRRGAELAALADGRVVDLLVVGGGVTGVGAALDAAARGLSVALIEAHDLAFGTSRFSSKLVHGGLRYLANGDLGLAYESAVERGVLMSTVAPHLIRALPQLVPLHEQLPARNAALTMAGLVAGDLLRRAARTPTKLLPGPRRVSGAEALALVPGLRGSGLRGGLLSFDGQLVDDARLVVALARTAAGFGARVLTRVRALELGTDGAQVRDELTGDTSWLRARSVLNATGVWAGELVESVRLRPSRGSHLVLDGTRIGLTGTALTIPVPGTMNRFALLLPQQDGRCYLGLTDEPLDGPIPDVPTVPDSDVDFLLELGSSVLRTRLTSADVIGRFAGLRPLIDWAASGTDARGVDIRSADLSRRHAVLTAPNGVITVVGGKLTTYRRMAQDAVDAVLAATGLPAGPCRTRSIPLVGAGSGADGSVVDGHDRLVSRYGGEAAQVLALAAADSRLARPLVADGEVLGAEVAWAVAREGALSAEDVLDRRTRLGLVDADRAAALPAVTALVDEGLDALPAEQP
ncbi:MAG TPA: glycerol-3-phosphate dehydrogenase/oxidase [Pseudonocardiaceae bacterium]|nr:glycerol-3-phosphate dehydrogenase/oxidase [Pseudonocardiaceae bacterium]